jgi:ABC-2 type transport system ATP-binding protein
MDPEAAVIEMRGLGRSFGRVRAVDTLDLAIGRGEIFGLVGPDGAGKTTTLRLLAAIMDPTRGTARVAGFDTVRQSEAIKRRIGYMAQQFSLYGDLSVAENLDFFADIFGVRGRERIQRVNRLLDFAHLQAFRQRRAMHLSGGMQKKLALACTLVHQPEIILLDEPTTGVDPVSRREFWDILTDLHIAGTTIVVSTPYMDEAERCSRIGLLYRGRLLVCDSPDKVRAMVPGDLLELRPAGVEMAARCSRLLAEMEGVLEIQTYGDLLHVFVDNYERRHAEVTGRLEQAQVVYNGLRRAQPRMEEAFISLIQRQEAERRRSPGEAR